MTVATIQHLTASQPGEEPFIGDITDGELCVNTTDGRVWVGNLDGSPVELGGACKNSPIGSLLFSNYIDIEISSPDNLPVANTNPLEIPSGVYREARVLLRFTQDLPANFSTYFDYPVNWGEESVWKVLSQEVYWGGASNFNTVATNPIDYFKRRGTKVLVELSSFGPSSAWMGRVIWTGQI